MEDLLVVLGCEELLRKVIPTTGFSSQSLESGAGVSRIRTAIDVLLPALAKVLCPSKPEVIHQMILKRREEPQDNSTETSGMGLLPITLDLIVHGNRETRLLAQAILAKSLSLQECKEVSQRQIQSNPVLTTKHGISKQKYRSLQCLYDTLKDGKSIPTQTYTYRVSLD